MNTLIVIISAGFKIVKKELKTVDIDGCFIRNHIHYTLHLLLLTPCSTS